MSAEIFMLFDNWHHNPTCFTGSTTTTYHHMGMLVNGQTFICNQAQIDNCIRQCAKQFMPIDQRACVQAVEARLAPYSKCFSGSSTVIVRGKRNPVQLKDIKAGDEVLDMTLQYVKVVGWLHRDELVETNFMELHHSLGSIEITPEHLIYCHEAQDYVPAKAASIVETVFVDGSMVPSKIITRNIIEKTGIYAPLTSSGTLLVNGINVSCYATPEELPFSVTQSAGQIALAPYRYLEGSILPDIQEYCRSLYSIFAL